MDKEAIELEKFMKDFKIKEEEAAKNGKNEKK